MSHILYIYLPFPHTPTIAFTHNYMYTERHQDMQVTTNSYMACLLLMVTYLSFQITLYICIRVHFVNIYFLLFVFLISLCLCIILIYIYPSFLPHFPFTNFIYKRCLPSLIYILTKRHRSMNIDRYYVQTTSIIITLIFLYIYIHTHSIDLYVYVPLVNH